MSTSVRFPPPFPIAKMSSLDLSLHDLRRARDEEEAALILREEKEIASIHSQMSSPVLERSDPVGLLGLYGPPDEPSPPDAPDVLLTSPPVEGTPTAPESLALPPETPSEEIPPATSSSISTATESSSVSTVAASVTSLSPVAVAIARQPVPSLVPPLPTLQSMLHRPEDVHRISALAQVEFEHSAQLNIFEWFVDAYQHNLEPKDKQGLIYLAASGKSENEVHHQCVPSHFRRATYYQRGEDMTLGDWILQKAETANEKCANKACSLPNVAHYEVLVHRETRLQIASPSPLSPLFLLSPADTRLAYCDQTTWS
jgi:1-phosphatidylinositol-3-phosphate 5-kinase